MTTDFNWLCKIILNKNNKSKHYDALIKLVSLFKLKWKHNEKDPRYRDTYLLYVAYLKRGVNRLRD